MRYRLMATYRGVPYEAGAGPTGAEVVLFAACPPPEELGFEPAPGHWRKRVSRAEIDALWESRPVGIFRGEPCIVLDDLSDRLHIAYLGTDPGRAAVLGYWQVDRGVFELLAPRHEVSGLAEERVERPLHLSAPAQQPASAPAYPYGTAPDMREWLPPPPGEAGPGNGTGPQAVRQVNGFRLPAGAGAPGPPVPPPPDPLAADGMTAARLEPGSGGFPHNGHSPGDAQSSGGYPRSDSPSTGGYPRSDGPSTGGYPRSDRPSTGGYPRNAGRDSDLPYGSGPVAGSDFPPRGGGRQANGEWPGEGHQRTDGGTQGTAGPTPGLPGGTQHGGREPQAPWESGQGQPVPSPPDPASSHAVPLARAVEAGQAADLAAREAAGQQPGGQQPAGPAPASAADRNAAWPAGSPLYEELARSRLSGEPGAQPGESGAAPYAGAQPPAEPPPPAWATRAGGSEPREGRSRSSRQRVTTRAVFCELADQAAIPRHAYALEAETDGAMCLLATDAGYEVFVAADGARHEVRTFADEEAAYFYLFGVLAAEAVRTGGLTPR